MQPREGVIKTLKKRRSTGTVHDRRFKCGCGRGYLSYPALYTHIKNKHNNIHPANTIIPKASQKKPSDDSDLPTKSIGLRELAAFLRYIGFRISVSEEEPDFSSLIEGTKFLSPYEIKALKKAAYQESATYEFYFFEICSDLGKLFIKDDFITLFQFLLYFRKEMLLYSSGNKTSFDQHSYDFYTEGHLSAFCNFFYTKRLSQLKSLDLTFPKCEIISEENSFVILLKLLTDLMVELRILKAKIELNTVN